MPRPRSEKSRFALELPTLDFYVLASSCADAALSKGRDVITGRFGVPRSKRYWQLVQAFANWPPDASGIVKFVRRFGPLIVPHGKPGERFSIRLEDWRDSQRSFQLAWERWKRDGNLGRPWTFFAPHEENIEHLDGQVKLSFTTVGRYLTFALHVLPQERLKVCGRPDCPHPYFIAQHLNERFCSKECSNWGDKQVKLRWWNKTGAGQRQAKSPRSSRRRRQ